MFKGLLGEKDKAEEQPEFVEAIKDAFHPVKGERASYRIEFTDSKKNLIIDVMYDRVDCYYGQKEDARVEVKTSKELFQKIVDGRSTFQRFMAADLTAKGSFHDIKLFDEFFDFT